MNVSDIIQHLDLQPHPEGGYFKETYRSRGKIDHSALPEEFSGDRHYSTGIYFLLTSDTFSAFHKIHQDEMWHFYFGDAIRLHMITDDGQYSNVLIGQNLLEGEQLQFVVPAGVWFAAEVNQNDSYALVGCTVSPGFDFADFTMPSRDSLLTSYPEHREIITRLTRE